MNFKQLAPLSDTKYSDISLKNTGHVVNEKTGESINHPLTNKSNLTLTSVNIIVVLSDFDS